METALIVALVAGAVALASTAITAFNAWRLEGYKAALSTAQDRHAEDKEISIYSESLSRAAYDLQSRLYNILRKDFAGAYGARGDARERAYFIENTTFLIAQFFCWCELTRQEIFFIDLRDPERTQTLLRLQDDIYGLWATDRNRAGFCIFAGEQRAIGEALITGSEEYTTCMGYGAFLKAFPRRKNKLIDMMRGELAALAADLAAAADRLERVQHALIDLLDVTDPDHLRFPRERRSKA